MCGIFGVLAGPRSDLGAPRRFARAVRRLFLLSESRGKEAAGLAVVRRDEVDVVRSAVSASRFVRATAFRERFAHLTEDWPLAAVGHSRLVTNGTQAIHENNQPVVKEGVVAVHNGIITNIDAIWHAHPNWQRTTALDTEIIPCLLRKLLKSSDDIGRLLAELYQAIEGVANLALLLAESDILMLATNNGSIYLAASPDQNARVFASERYIVERFLQDLRDGREWPIQHLGPGQAVAVDLQNLSSNTVEWSSGLSTSCKLRLRSTARMVVEHRMPENGERRAAEIYVQSANYADEYPAVRESVSRLRRCTRCVLPETMPFIDFDGDGVCSYCRHYRPLVHLGIEALRAAVEPYRRGKGNADCLIAFSGGRDSSYGLHVAKRVLGLNPIAYTYDWGMVTDLARRNQMRLCGKLGVEHILVSADIAWKRENIRKNVAAWLSKPDLGAVPLFMAGDKQYFYYANKVGRQTGCRMVVLCENLLETTRFKFGFCGIAPTHNTEHTYTLSVLSKLRMLFYYASRFVITPAYLNASLLDSLSAFACYYMIRHDYLNLYKYIRWEENEINDTLRAEYAWETATDTNTTWRIGDGTAPFYNFIYYTLAGFSENDTFRSNQIREGMLSREDALRLVEGENQPRYDSIKWYCDTIGIGFSDTIRQINAAPKRYPWRE